MRYNLTERFVNSLKPTAGRSPIYRDEELVGFGVQVRPNGRKTFTLDYVIAGWRRRMFIGDYPDWTASTAREEAKRKKREIDLGNDPLARRDERRAELTIEDLVARYIDEHCARLSPDHARDQRNMLHKFVLPAWKMRKVTDIRTSDVDRLLSEVAKGRARPSKAVTRKKRSQPLAPPKPTPIQANRVGGIIRKMFNLAVRWELRPNNPAAAFIRNPENPRERFLDVTEIERLAQVLGEHPNQRMANVIRLLMLTGARRGEVLKARWEQFDLDRAVWTKPAATTKQRRTHRTPISSATVALLRMIRAGVPDDRPWVFPGDAPGKSVAEIKRFWQAVRTEANLEGVRMHDLRHTFASLLVSGGMSLPMIGRLLGHTQVQTTLRYAHLFDDPLRTGLNHVGEMLRPQFRLIEISPPERPAAPQSDNRGVSMFRRHD